MQVYRKVSPRQYVRKNWQLYLLMLPAVIAALIFKYLPLSGLRIAFQDFNIFSGYDGSAFVGLMHFEKLLTNDYFIVTLTNSFIISVYKLVFIFPLPIILAISINEARCLLFKRSIQTMVYLPHFLSWSIVYGIFHAILSSNGPVNDVLAILGIERVPFFVTPSVFRAVLVFTDAWKSVGWGCIVYLSALMAIDPQQYEAARLDGAGKFQQIWHITLPGISSTVVIMLILRLGNLIRAGFEQVFIMYNPTVYNVADILDTYVYRMGMGQQEYSYASTVGLFNSIVSLTLVLSSNWAAKHWFGRSMW